MKEIEEILKEIVEETTNKKIQMFDCIGFMPDFKITMYSKGKKRILYAPGYSYVELIGFSKKEYNYYFEKYGY